MGFQNKVMLTPVSGFLITSAASSELRTQDIKYGVVNSRDQILNPTTNQQQQTQQNTNQTSPPAEKGNPGLLPCSSPINPKCPESPSRPADVKGKS